MGYPRNNENSCLRNILTVWLTFMARLDSGYLVNIKTIMITITEEKSKTKTLAKTHAGTLNYYRLT